MRVAEALAETLTELGVDTVFGVVGSGNFHLTNAMVARGARFYATRHEAGAVTATDAYSRVTGKVAATSVHQGPGVTNTITGLTEAAKGRTPMLVLAADTPTGTGASKSNFAIDQQRLAEAVGALYQRIEKPETATQDISRAYARAISNRRPVLVGMPIDVQSAPAHPDGLNTIPSAPDPIAPLPSELGEAVRALNRAERPLLIAGRGAVTSKAKQAIEKLAEKTGALVATSAVANGLFAASPYSLGISGGFASPTAAELIHSADVVVAFGASLNMWTTRRGRLLNPEARVVKVDIDPEAGADVTADAKLTAEAMLETANEATRWRTTEIADRIKFGQWRNQPFDDRSTDERIDPRRLSVELDRMLPADRIVATDSGHFMGWPPMYWRVPDEQGFVFTQGFQSIGLGLATTVGAAIARPDRLAVAALGDGGLTMAAAELETVARLQIPMLIVVYDDAAYGAEVHHFGPDGDPLEIVKFPDADLAALARGAGLEAITVRTTEDLNPLHDWLQRREKPLLIDAKIVTTVVAEWLSEAFGH